MKEMSARVKLEDSSTMTGCKDGMHCGSDACLQKVGA